MRRPSITTVLVGLVVSTLLLAACSDDGGSDPKPASSATTTPGVGGDLTIFAAASLTEAFTELGQAFEAAHPDVTVTFNFAASSALAQQLNEGAAADVFVSADEANMKKVTDAGNASGPAVIARNRLSILVEKGNPKKIADLPDLARPDVVAVLCAPEVPCGKFATAALAKAAVTVKPASLEENVKAVVARVTLGEADAGIVYVTDVKAAADKADGVPISGADDPALEAVYPMAVTESSANPVGAAAWRAFVLGPEGASVLAKYGFGAP